MSKRPYVSVSGPFYTELKAYALKNKISISSVVERAIAPDLGIEPPVPSRKSRRYRGPRP